LKDQEVVISALGSTVMKRFTLLFHLARIFLALNVSLLVIALCQSPPKTTLVTAVFTAPAFLWATPFDLRHIGAVLKGFIWAKYDQKVEHDSPISNEPFVIKRVPGMKAIFDGIIRGYVLLHPDVLWLFDLKTVVVHSSSFTQHCSYHGNRLMTPSHGQLLRLSFGRRSIAPVIV
jgi:hypothetical protein